MKKLLLMTLICNAAVLSLPAHAQVGYLGLSVGRENYDLRIPAASSASTDRTTGYKLFGGFDAAKSWGAEVGYADFRSSDTNFTLASTSATLRSKPTAFYLAGKGMASFDDTFSFFGKLGATRNHTEISGADQGQGLIGTTNRTRLYAGIGGQYNLNKNVSFTLEYENFGRLTDTSNRLGVFSLGVRYNF